MDKILAIYTTKSILHSISFQKGTKFLPQTLRSSVFVNVGDL